VVLIVALAALASVASASRLPGLLVWDGHGYAVRPPSIYYTGDGTGIIGRLPGGYRAVGRRPGGIKWEKWNGGYAFGAGTVWLKNCVPDCADSLFRRYAVRVTATRVRHGHFTRMTLRYRYNGSAVTDRRCVVGSGWAVVC
jgi:hypothetical protein